MNTQCNCGGPVDEILRSQGEALFKRLGVWEVVQHVGQVENAISRGHQLLRRGERAKALGLDIGQMDESKAEREFALARRHATTARQIVTELTASPDWENLIKTVEPILRSEKLQSALLEGRERWATMMLESDLPASDTTEIMEIWDTVSTQVRDQGLTGIFNQLKEHLNEFNTILRPEENWGRHPHSPLEWWQWLIIILVIGLAIAALIVCFFWAGCSWIKAIFVGLCVGAAAGTAQPWWFGVCLSIGF